MPLKIIHLIIYFICLILSFCGNHKDGNSEVTPNEKLYIDACQGTEVDQGPCNSSSEYILLLTTKKCNSVYQHQVENCFVLALAFGKPLIPLFLQLSVFLCIYKCLRFVGVHLNLFFCQSYEHNKQASMVKEPHRGDC